MLPLPPSLCCPHVFTQILRHGFFHADPHPGNVAVDPASGRAPVLLFYDFGMMGQIVPDVRVRLLDVFYGIYRCARVWRKGLCVQGGYDRERGGGGKEHMGGAMNGGGGVVRNTRECVEGPDVCGRPRGTWPIHSSTPRVCVAPCFTALHPHTMHNCSYTCRQDGSGVVRALVELGVIKPQGDMLSIRRAINYFIENIKRQTERQETIGVKGARVLGGGAERQTKTPRDQI